MLGISTVGTQIYFQSLSDLNSLKNMTDPAKVALASDIKAGPSSISYEKAINIIASSSDVDKESFFNHPEVQKELLESVMIGSVIESGVMNAVIIDGLEKCNACINPEEQNKILGKELERFFETLCAHPDAMVACKFFTGREAQSLIAQAIFGGYFGNNPSVLTALVGQLAVFDAPEAQQAIAYAIWDGHFGDDASVLMALVEKLAVFTNPKTQLEIASAISDDRFGKNADVLKALTIQVQAFTDPVARRAIATEISEGRSAFSMHLTFSSMRNTILQEMNR